MGWLKKVWNKWRGRATNQIKEVVEEVVQKAVKQNLVIFKITVEDFDDNHAVQLLANELNLNKLARTEGGNWKAKTRTGKSVIISVTSL